MRCLLFSLCLILPGGFARAECPPAPEIGPQLDALIAEAQAAQNAAQGQGVSNRMWELWALAPDETAQAILDRGMGRRQSYNFVGALEDFDRLVAYCPEYAEGYNQRAFVHFLRADYPAALVDLDRALERSPRHVAALSGKALTLMAMGRLDAARATLQAAMALNPWIPERNLAERGGPLAPVGQKL